jgi:hypothetical protein
MVQDRNWEFINDPSSNAFRLWENAAAYYAGNQNTKSEYYTQLMASAKELIQFIEQHLKE